MSKTFNVVFWGLGSVGQRHLSNLLKNYPNQLNISAIRHSKNQTVISNGKTIQVESLDDYYGMKSFETFQSIEHEPIDMAFICNPSSLHSEIVEKCLNRGINIFVEKPVCTSSGQINSIQRALGNIRIRNSNIVTYTAFQSRFNPLISMVKETISNFELGKPINASFNWGTYLPLHHKYEDYKTGYAARQDLGGGVVMCLCHEIDLICHLLGFPFSVYALEGAKSKLDIPVEDTVNVLMTLDTKSNKIPVNLNLSFTQFFEERYFTILFEEGHLKADLVENVLNIYYNNGKQTTKHFEIERNDLFVSEIRHFVECVSEKKQTAIPLEEGLGNVKIALSILNSIKSGKVECVDKKDFV